MRTDGRYLRVTGGSPPRTASARLATASWSIGRLRQSKRILSMVASSVGRRSPSQSANAGHREESSRTPANMRDAVSKTLARSAAIAASGIVCSACRSREKTRLRKARSVRSHTTDWLPLRISSKEVVAPRCSPRPGSNCAGPKMSRTRPSFPRVAWARARRPRYTSPP